MGLADRDYVRRPPPRTPGAALNRWSANTWLIVACVLVFVVDGFLPTWYVPMADPELLPGVPRLPETAVPTGQVYEDRPGHHIQPILERPGGNVVGWQVVAPMQPLAALLHFSTARLIPRFEFWRLIGFQFLHANVTHLLFNMVALYFFGPLVEEALGRKRYLAFYLLCGMFGALLFSLLNLAGYIVSQRFGHGVMVPGLIFDSRTTPLVGASAGVFGVLMAGAYLAPSATVWYFFIVPMRLRTVAYALVVVEFIWLLWGTQNQGGHAGHLGGAAAGWYFIRHREHLHGFFDILGRADPTSHHYRAAGWRRRLAARRQGEGVAEVDRILDKVRAGGTHSLTPRERQTLLEATERQRK